MSAPAPAPEKPPAKAPEQASAKARDPRGGSSRTLRDFHEEEKLGASYDRQLLRRLWPFMRPHRRFFWASLALLLVIAALNLLRPLVMGGLVASATEAQGGGALLRHGLLLSLLVVGTQVLSFLQGYAMQIAGARAMADLRTSLFGFMQRLRLRYFDRTPVGRLVTRATNDVDALGELFASGVLNALGDLVALVGIVVLMFILDARLALIAFASLPAVGLMVYYVRGQVRQAYRDIRVKTARLNAFLNEQVAGMSVVQAYAREDEMAAEFDGINVEYRDANKRSVYFEAVLDAAIEMVGTVCIASILWWAGLKRVSDSSLTFPLVVTFTQYIKQFFEPVSLLAQRYTLLQSAMSGAERIFKLLDETVHESESEGNGDGKAAPASAAPAAGGREDEALALERVTFGYNPERPVLQEVSLHVRRGERVALVGATGAGKSTVTSLLLRLYDFQSGAVRVLGRPAQDFDRRELRRQFAVVPQDVILFAGSVASNVAVGEETPDHRRVEEALSRVGALDLFLRRPGGLDAPVDERGANFSAGERQLLAFARALYKDAPILILDEATASIDSDTEARLQAALEAVMAGRTALIIAHRLSTIRAVDRIIVFHRGRVVETGTHDELLAQDGVYARLHRLQFAQEALKQEETRATGG